MAEKSLVRRPFRAAPPTRQRIADQIFHALARSILDGELKPGEPLTPQRDLAVHFSVSPLIVRQAVHRLEDLGLVRVKQGSTTIVLDPAQTADLRILELQLELAEPSPRFLDWLLEAQTASALGMLTLAESRIRPEDVDRLVRLTEDADPSSAQDLRRFRAEYWGCIAKATRNPLLQQSRRWWIAVLDKLERSGHMRELKDPLFPSLYQGLNQKLAEGRGSVELYLSVIRQLHQMTAAKHTAGGQSARAASATRKGKPRGSKRDRGAARG